MAIFLWFLLDLIFYDLEMTFRSKIQPGNSDFRNQQGRISVKKYVAKNEHDLPLTRHFPFFAPRLIRLRYIGYVGIHFESLNVNNYLEIRS